MLTLSLRRFNDEALVAMLAHETQSAARELVEQTL